MTREHKNLFTICIILSAFVFFVSAYLNFSYLHPDEYFQIVEFASFKLGITHSVMLSWEYADKIRPGLQPFLSFEIFRFLDLIHVRDHYTHLFALRFLSMLFTLFSISIFCIVNLRIIPPRYHRLYILTTFLFWAPYMFGVRFSSEAWSGDIILLATSLLLYLDSDDKLPKRNGLYFAIGLLLGFAFLFRFQTAFFSVGMGAWLLFIKREKFTSLLLLIAGVSASLTLGLITDRWLYGEWVCSPWLYFQSNILKGVAGEFGTSPFYTYFIMLFTFLSPIIGAIALLSLFFLFVRLPKHIYTWMLLPFLLGHSLIGHKELRFMFPLMLFLPAVCILVYQVMKENDILSKLYNNKAIRKFTIILLLLCNFSFLLVFVIAARSVSNDPKNFAPYIHQVANLSPVNIIYTDPEAHPYILPHSRYKSDIYPEYMSEKNISNTKLGSWDSITTLPQINAIQLISANKYEIEHIPSMHATLSRSIVVASTLPEWLSGLPLAKYLGQGVKDELDKNDYLLIELRR